MLKVEILQSIRYDSFVLKTCYLKKEVGILQEQEISKAIYNTDNCHIGRVARVCFGDILFLYIYWAFEVLVYLCAVFMYFKTASRDDDILFQVHLPHLQTLCK